MFQACCCESHGFKGIGFRVFGRTMHERHESDDRAAEVLFSVGLGEPWLASRNQIAARSTVMKKKIWLSVNNYQVRKNYETKTWIIVKYYRETETVEWTFQTNLWEKTDPKQSIQRLSHSRHKHWAKIYIKCSIGSPDLSIGSTCHKLGGLKFKKSSPFRNFWNFTKSPRAYIPSGKNFQLHSNFITHQRGTCQHSLDFHSNSPYLQVSDVKNLQKPFFSHKSPTMNHVIV